VAAIIGVAAGRSLSEATLEQRVSQLRQELLSQYAALVRALGFDEPFAVRFSPVGQRRLQLDVSVDTQVVREVYVDWGDVAAPDPVGGTRIYPGRGIEVGQTRLRLSPIVHDYSAVPPEGLRTTAKVRIVALELSTVRPETLTRERLNPARRLWVLPYGIVLDPPEAKLRFLSCPSPKISSDSLRSTEIR
jgi:hypothetical protein